MELSGWDTHANQGMAGGALDRLLGQLAEGLVAFRTEMGDRVGFDHAGRDDRVRPHGAPQRHARHRPRHRRRGVRARPAPGALRRGGRLAGAPAGALYEGRDLEPTLDTRALLKSAVAGTFDLTAAQLDRVFPGSSAARVLPGLMA